jgi:predicted ribosomally synthesized peptide with nif11-like leader
MQQVKQDPSLQEKLSAALDKEQASRLAVELGKEMGLEFNEAEVLDLDYGGELDESELKAVSGGHKLPPHRLHRRR